MPTKAHRRIYPLSGERWGQARVEHDQPLAPACEIQHIEMVLDAKGVVISKRFVLENGQRVEEKDLIFTESDPDELTAMEIEAKMLAEKKTFVMGKDGRPRWPSAPKRRFR